MARRARREGKGCARAAPERERAGFTLVEVVVALAIFLVGLLGLVEMTGLATAHNARNLLRDEAVLLGEEQMAQLFRQPESRLVPFARLTSAGGARGSSTRYLVTRTSSRIPGSSSYQLTVRVSWAYKNLSSHHEVQSMRSYSDGK